MALKYGCVLFDFDGTVADTGEGIRKSVAYSLDRMGRPALDEALLDRFIGPPLHDSYVEYCGMTAEAAEEWQRDVKAEFSLWADDKAACDATGMNDFYAIQQLAFASMLTSGDCFVLRQEREPTRMRPYGLRLRVIEADRVSSPAMSARSSTLWTEGENPRNGNKIHDGVEVDKAGMVVAYHICNHYPFSLVSGGEPDEWVRVKAYGDNTGLPNVLHLMSSERPEQYRGVSYLAQIIEPILQTNLTFYSWMIQGWTNCGNKSGNESI